MNESSLLAINYVENNISDSLDLKTVSDSMKYSKYHYHRLFLSDIGISVVEYIRRRRIYLSASLIKNSNETITNIAFASGFSNVDTFIRVFKKYFGITPNDYRKRYLSTRDTEEESFIMVDFTSTLTHCTDEEKNVGIMALDKIIELSSLAHKEGLLSLENTRHKDIYLAKAIELLLDGTPPKQLRIILTNYIQSTDLTKGELLIRVIYMEGILMIQKGEYPWNIRKFLNSLFGENYIAHLHDYYHNKVGYEIVLNEYIENSDYTKTCALERELKGIDMRSMQRLLRDCDNILISIGSYNLKGSTKELIVKSLPSSRRKILAEVILLVGQPTEPQINDVQNEIIRIIKELRVSNDIR